ncbi:hypothetical protein C8A00DRAFT_31152 [Chaetomidium leptoderma]|uniref:Uncharacterized protein n=1 Tax=Chaetomidium leptoderma TaxID=669021 RepID=A0AAN6ZXU5_9PEZI|nr:hypothetical protein C8A00DRAFT_31152 [Chaetomidium leptoderma]
MADKPERELRITPIPGARPLTPGDLDGLTATEKHDEVVARIKYLVNDRLEEPPHIRRVREIINGMGLDWSTASDEKILSVLEQRVPKPLFHSTFWKRWPQPTPDSGYHELMTRIHRAELDYYGVDSTSLGGTFLHMLRDARSNPDPASFYQRLRKAELSIGKIMHFTRKTVPGGDVQRLSLPYKLEAKRTYFVGDMAAFLGKMRGSRRAIPHATFEIPPDNDTHIKDGIMEIDSNTFLFDTTLNNSVLQAIQEANFLPAVIMKQLTFWHDGADEDAEALKDLYSMDYKTTHWLTEYYDVYSRHPGSGFVTCSPTIYIRKGHSLLHTLKKSASSLLGRARSMSGQSAC